MLEIQKEVLKEANKTVSPEFQAAHIDDLPPNKQNGLLWFAINLLYKLIKKALNKKQKTK